MKNRFGIGFPIIILSIGVCSALLHSCEQTCYDGELNQNEVAVDCGGDCVPCDSTSTIPEEPTCFDGIQNQDETDVDCGGICLPCSGDTTSTNSQLCTGNGSSSMLPLSVGNYWRYAVIGGSPFTLSITGTQTLNGNDYFRMETGGSFGPAVDFYREDGSGNIYHLQADAGGAPNGNEFLYYGGIAGWPVVAIGLDSIAVINNDTTLSQAGCTYTGAKLLYEYNVNSLQVARIMESGIGVVQFNFVGIGSTAYLDSIAVN